MFQIRGVIVNSMRAHGLRPPVGRPRESYNFACSHSFRSRCSPSILSI